eukprot:7895218-Karenia_brevis.AAC.1
MDFVTKLGVDDTELWRKAMTKDGPIQIGDRWNNVSRIPTVAGSKTLLVNCSDGIIDEGMVESIKCKNTLGAWIIDNLLIDLSPLVQAQTRL